MNLERRIFGDKPNIQSMSEYDTTSEYNKRIMKKMMNAAPFSFGMLTLVIVIFILEVICDIRYGLFSLKSISSWTLGKFGANNTLLVNVEHQYYRLFTAMLLHGSFSHIIMNSVSFVLYLIPVQSRLNNRWLYFFVLIYGGMLGNCAFVSANLLKGTLHSGAVGASTSICSVIGFDMVYRLLRIDDVALNLRRIIITLLFIFILSLMPGVDFFGHFGSLLAGGLICLAFLKANRSYYSQKQTKRLYCGGILGLALYSIILLSITIFY